MSRAFNPNAFSSHAFLASGAEDHRPAFSGGAFLASAFLATSNEAPSVPGVDVTLVGLYPVPSLHAGVAYVSGAARPIVGEVQAGYQQGRQSQTGWTSSWRDSRRLPTAVHDRFQDGVPVSSGVSSAYSDAQALRRGAVVRFQQALQLATSATTPRWQDALRLRASRSVRFQEGDGLDVPSVSARFQDALQLRRRAVDVVQDGVPVRFGASSRFSVAVRTDVLHDSRYQNATQLPIGLWVDGGSSGGSVDPEPEATIIVPVREVYIVLNNHLLRRVEGAVLLPTFSMGLSLDVGSWTWSFQASLPIEAFDDVRPDSDGTPVEVEATINGVPYRWLVENRSRDRRFGDTRFTISGRGLLARLGDPFAPVLNFGNSEMRTGQQLMDDVLTLNGVSLGWTVDWQIEDWVQPANVWTKQGTYIEALTEIAEAVGAYIQPTRATQGLRVLAQYPSLPRDWAAVTPDLQLPDGAVTVESTGWAQKPRYNRVYVSGTSDGVVGRVTLAGTDGTIVAPDAVSPLIGDEVAARMRGQRVLGETGHIATYGLRTAVGIRDEEGNPIGIIPPGRFIRYIENGVPKIGLSRAVQVDIDPVEAWQTIQVEVHEDVEPV